MKLKKLRILLSLTLFLVLGLTTRAESTEMEKAITLTMLPDTQLQKTAIVTTSLAEYSNLKAVQTNTKVNIYLYYGMSASDIIEMVRADSPDTIYLMGTENDISEDIKTVFNVTVPTKRINQVELDESALKNIKMDEALKIIKENTETLKKNNILNLKWDSKSFEDLKDKARKVAFIGDD